MSTSEGASRPGMSINGTMPAFDAQWARLKDYLDAVA